MIHCLTFRVYLVYTEIKENRKESGIVVGKNIKKAREDRGLKQEELAERLNVTRQAVSNWENEKTQPSIEMLNQLALVLEVSVEELIYGGERKSTSALPPVVNKVTKEVRDGGVTLGSVIAAVISYAKWQSIGWAILHGLLGWIYVLYYIIKY